MESSTCRISLLFILIAVVPIKSALSEPSLPKRTGRFSYRINYFAYSLWKLGRSINKFGMDLLNKMDDENDGEQIISPFPVAYNMAAMTVSASGQTFDEICFALNLYGFKVPEVHWTYPKMCDLLHNNINPMMTRQVWFLCCIGYN